MKSFQNQSRSVLTQHTHTRMGNEKEKNFPIFYMAFYLPLQELRKCEKQAIISVKSKIFRCPF